MAEKEKKGKSAAAMPKDAAGKAKALDDALSMIEKQYGKGAIMKMGDGAKVLNIEVIPTGCLSLDVALGIGGMPRGRIVEIYGPESSGKTTVALHCIAEAQKMGGICAFIDAEHALDPVYAENLGVDLANLYVSQPDSGEQALDIVDALVRSGAIDMIVVDSVAALTPRAEIEGEMGDSHVGLQARLMSMALRKIAGNANKGKTCLIFINQLREKVGVVYGNPETTPGGKALKFYASVRLDIRRGEAMKGDEGQVGNRTKAKVVKNKLAPPFKVAEFDVLYGKGISQEGCVIDIGTDYGIIQKSGSWFAYNDDKIGQGREKAIETLRTHPELRDEIYNKVMAAVLEKRAANNKADPIVTSVGKNEDEETPENGNFDE